MRTLWSKLKAIFLRRDQELDDELRFHIDMLVEENLARGMSLGEARLAARREFGGAEQIKADYRDRRGFVAFESLLQDVRFALRLLIRDRRFTAVAALTLMLGIGTTTVLFAVVERALLRPLPFPHAERLVAIESRFPNGSSGTSAPGVFIDWRERSSSFERMAGFAGPNEFTWVGPEMPRNLRVLRVSQDFFELTGMPLLEGRPWTVAEDAPGGPLVAIVAKSLVQQDLDDGVAVLGRQIQLNDLAYTIVGVVPSGFRLGAVRDPEIFIPLQASQRSRTGGSVMAIGKLREGVSLSAARTELETITAGIRDESPVDQIDAAVTLLGDWVVGDMRVVLWTVLGAVGCIWLMGCANLANMQLARNAVRVKELAVRASLGAGRFRLIRQILIEAALTASLGGALGLVFTGGVLRALPAIQAIYVPRVEEMHFSLVVLAFAAFVTALSGLLVGLGPALQVRGGNLNLALSGAAFLGQSGGRLRGLLVVSQLAICVVLLAGAGLLANSFVRLLHINLGFERSAVMVVRPKLLLLEPDAAVRFLSELQVAVSRLPQVESAALTNLTPLQAVRTPLYLKIDPQQEERLEADARQVTPGYFDLLRIPLQAGRDLEQGDAVKQPIPVVLSRAAVHLLFGDSDPLGRRIHNPVYRSMKELQVVGVVADVRQFSVRQAPSPIVYLPVGLGSSPSYVIARLAPGAPIPASAIREILHGMNPALTVDITTMNARFDEQTSESRFYFWLLGGFAFSGLLIAAVGVYGVMAHAVAQRTREFAIRIALGARRGQILWNAVRSAVWMTVAGLSLGLIGAVTAARLIAALLYEVKPSDPATFVAVSGLLSAMALSAACLAGRQATVVSPASALKQD